MDEPCPWCGEKATTDGIVHDPSCPHYYVACDAGGGATQVDSAEDAIASKLDMMNTAAPSTKKMSSLLDTMLGSLTPKERRVYEMRNNPSGDPVTLERIREIERKALEKLRRR